MIPWIAPGEEQGAFKMDVGEDIDVSDPVYSYISKDRQRITRPRSAARAASVLRLVGYRIGILTNHV